MFRIIVRPRMSHTFEEWCAKLTAWRRARGGAIPKRTKDNSDEHILANWINKTQPRKDKSLGAKPSQRQLTSEEVSMLDAALAPGLCLEEEAAVDPVAEIVEDVGSQADVDADSSFEQRCAQLAAWRRANGGVVPKQKSDNVEERRLANWVSMAVPRKAKASGAGPSKRQLTPEEASMLDAALAPGLCLVEEHAAACGTDNVEAAGSRADFDSAVPRKRLRAKSAASSDPGQCSYLDGSAQSVHQRRVMEAYNNDDASAELAQHFARESHHGGLAEKSKLDKQREREQAACEAVQNIQGATAASRFKRLSTKTSKQDAEPPAKQQIRSRRYDIGFWGIAGGKKKPGKKTKNQTVTEGVQDEMLDQIRADNQKDADQCR